MSLILEALKKVERERATPEQRGFLVLGPTAWAPSRSNLAWVLGMIAAAAVAGGAVYAADAASGAAPCTRCRGRTSAPPQRSGRGTAADAPPAARRRGRGPPPDSYAPAPAARRHRPRPRAPPRPGRPRRRPVRRSSSTPSASRTASRSRWSTIAWCAKATRFDGVRILRIGAAEVEVEVAGARRTLRF